MEIHVIFISYIKDERGKKNIFKLSNILLVSSLSIYSNVADYKP